MLFIVLSLYCWRWVISQMQCISIRAFRSQTLHIVLLKWSALCPDLWAEMPGKGWQFLNHSMEATSMWSHTRSLTCLEKLKPKIHVDSGKESTCHGYPSWHSYSISADYLWQTHIQKTVSKQQQFVWHSWPVVIPQLSSNCFIARTEDTNGGGMVWWSLGPALAQYLFYNILETWQRSFSHIFSARQLLCISCESWTQCKLPALKLQWFLASAWFRLTYPWYLTFTSWKSASPVGPN